jgi:nicotinamide mononucleotide transporter
VDGLTTQLLEQLAAMPTAEIVAVFFAVAYLLLAIRQNIWCWFCAGVSTAIFVQVYATANLYMESALNVFYFAMAIYGWFSWRSGPPEAAGLAISVWSRRVHFVALVAILIMAALSGFLLATYTSAAFPYVDSATTFAAIWATFLVARKVLENWWYWLIIDVISVFIYWSRGLELTAVLFVVYVVLIPVGLLSWTRDYRKQAAEDALAV